MLICMLNVFYEKCMVLHSSLAWESVALLKERDDSVSSTSLKQACLVFCFLWLFLGYVCIPNSLINS